MIDDSPIANLKRTISTLEWDINVISNKELKAKKIKLLEESRLQLNRLSNF